MSATPAMPRVTPAFRPRQLEKRPACQSACAVSGEIRRWIGIVAQRGKTGLTLEEACEQSWRVIVEGNPFPAVLGRICPHPCEAACNRATFDTAVSICALERFLGDWAIARGLPLPRLEQDLKPETIGVVGAGPGGLSFAYQMARRGYRTTVYEKQERPGGVLRYGIPRYRLARSVLDAEIQRIVDLGVEVQLGVCVGDGMTLAELRERHDVVYLAIGAQRARKLGIPGEDEPAVWSGTDYLRSANNGEEPVIGRRVCVIGGGNTAVDAARTARRSGAEVTIAYRRSRSEMPAIESEVDDAIAEAVRFEYLVTPRRLEPHRDSRLTLVLSRMKLGERDESGRRRPVPVADSEFALAADTVIVAASQEPDWTGLEALHGRTARARGPATPLDEGLWLGGDVVELGIAGDAVYHGRLAAEATHRRLRGLPPAAPDARRDATADDVLFDFHSRSTRAEPSRVEPDAALHAPPDVEISRGIDEAAFLAETTRCLSCGSCFGCQQCWMYCTLGCLTPADDPSPGFYHSLALDRCVECGKCVEVCPSGFLELV